MWKHLVIALSLVATTVTSQVLWENGKVVSDPLVGPLVWFGGQVQGEDGGGEEGDPNLWLHWAFTSGDTNAVTDLSGNSRDAVPMLGISNSTYVESSATMLGYWDNESAVGLNNNGFVYTNATALDKPYTIELWFSGEAGGSQSSSRSTTYFMPNPPSNQQANEGVGYNSATKFDLEVRTSDRASSDVAWLNDTWNHYYAVFTDSNRVHAYFNGQLVINTTHATDTTTSEVFSIMSGADNTFSGQRGKYTGVKVWSIDNGTNALNAFNESRTNYGYVATDDITNGLQLAYLMEYDGIAADGSGNTNHGTLSGPVWEAITNGAYITGIYDFDGVNDWIDIPAETIVEGTGVESYAFSFWFNTDTTNTYVKPFEYSDDGISPSVAFNLNTNGNIRVYTPSAPGGGSDDIAWVSPGLFGTNEWHHFAFTSVSNSHVAITFDGVQVYSNAFSAGFTDTSAGRRIGTSRTGDQDFDGQINFFRAYQEDITSLQWGEIYTNEAPSMGVTP